ncbi:hypothetical protein QQP08_005007, partial [Theobroma cacao]
MQEMKPIDSMWLGISITYINSCLCNSAGESRNHKFFLLHLSKEIWAGACRFFFKSHMQKVVGDSSHEFQCLFLSVAILLACFGGYKLKRNQHPTQ